VTVEELFDRVAERVSSEDAGVERARIMRSMGLRAGGKFFAFVRDGDLVVKLPAERVTALVASGEGAPFVGSRERVMREWVVLRPANEEACAAYVAEARGFAGS
jgi:hypothetical protein